MIGYGKTTYTFEDQDNAQEDVYKKKKKIVYSVKFMS